MAALHSGNIFSLYFLLILMFADVSGNCSSKGDIVFLLDESGSVGYSNFQTMKSFVHDFLVHFSIGPAANQFSVVKFESYATEVFGLNRYSTLSSIQSAVLSITYSNGGTSIGSALDFARQFSFTSTRGARTDAAKIVILITDGQSSISDEAELLKDQYVTIYCVGVTSGINEQLLRNVSTHNDYTYITDSFTTLSALQSFLAEKSCADQIDDCLNSPCQNGGTCEDQLGKYVCHCNGTTTDKDCYIPGLPSVSTGSGTTTYLGGSAYISCTVTTGIYTISGVFWEHQYNGVTSILETFNSSKYGGGTVLTPSLTIYSFAVSDIGSYRCSAKNYVGMAHSPTMAFIDIPKSAVNISTVSPVPAHLGQDVTLICNVSSTYPPVASVTWELNGARIDAQSGGRYQGGNTSTPSLLIINLQTSDLGSYTCSVTNLYSSNNVTIQLITMSSAVFEVTTVSSATGETGGNVTLICNVTSTYSEVASFTWELDGSRINAPSEERYQGGTVSSPSLFISDLRTTDQGNYTCSASNSFGTRQAYVFLTITDSDLNSALKNPCDSCGTFYDCDSISVENPCALSTWKVALTSLLSAGALVAGALSSYALHKYKTRRSQFGGKGSKIGPYIDFPQRDLGVQKMIFRM